MDFIFLCTGSRLQMWQNNLYLPTTQKKFFSSKKILIKKFILMPAKKTKSTYCVSLKLDKKAKAQHQLVGPAWWSSLTDQFFIFEALPSFHIQIMTFQFVHCRSFRVRQRCCLWNSWSKHWINLTLSGLTFWSAWFDPPRKSLKEMSETSYCYLEVRTLSKLGTHEKFQVEISKTGWDFMIWKFEEIEISPWVDSQKYP